MVAYASLVKRSVQLESPSHKVDSGCRRARVRLQYEHWTHQFAREDDSGCKHRSEYYPYRCADFESANPPDGLYQSNAYHSAPMAPNISSVATVPVIKNPITIPGGRHARWRPN